MHRYLLFIRCTWCTTCESVFNIYAPSHNEACLFTLTTGARHGWNLSPSSSDYENKTLSMRATCLIFRFWLAAYGAMVCAWYSYTGMSRYQHLRFLDLFALRNVLFNYSSCPRADTTIQKSNGITGLYDTEVLLNGCTCTNGQSYQAIITNHALDDNRVLGKRKFRPVEKDPETRQKGI